MKKYDNYKDSGIEWIGEIPEHWKCFRLKNLVKEPLKYGANESAEEDNPLNPRYIRITDFGNDGLLKDDTFKSLPIEIASNFLLEEGDLLFARSGATVGKTFLFKNYDGIACFAGYLIKATFDKDKIDSTYINYFTRSNYYENWKMSVFQQATIQNIGADKYNQLLVSIPDSIAEQTAIANYLDHKTNQIDTLISKKEQFITLLQEERTAVINQAVTKGLDPKVKMKDSGIEWLGEIPEHWEVKKLAFEFNTLNTKRIPLSAEERGIMELRKYDYYGASGVIDKVENYIFDEDLILIGEDGANLLTRSKRLAFIASGKFWVNNHAHIIKPINGNINYFCELLELIDYTIYISGSAQPKLTQEALMSIKIPVPPISEQNVIFDYLKDEFNKIDTLISKSQQEIELLKEYKTALIREVVTGKVDVRDVVLN